MKRYNILPGGIGESPQAVESTGGFWVSHFEAMEELAKARSAAQEEVRSLIRKCQAKAWADGALYAVTMTSDPCWGPSEREELFQFNPHCDKPRIAWQCSWCGVGHSDPEWTKQCPACGMYDGLCGSVSPDCKPWDGVMRPNPRRSEQVDAINRGVAFKP
jgi:hypothetical protein